MAKAPTLETYTWIGTNRRGERLTGEMNATTPAYVKSELRKQGVLPTKVRKKPKSLLARTRITAQDTTLFTRQMATMLTAGIPLIQAMDLVARGNTKPTMQALINTLKTTIEGGSSIAEALQKHPKYFNELYCNLISAGERSGSLDIMFDRIATYKEKTESLKGKIKKALFYPAAVIAVALIVTAAMLIFVVPQFESLFTGFGAGLPAPTRVVINMSKWVQSYWWILLAIIMGISWGVKMGLERSEKFVHLLDRISLRLPIVGNILVKATIARFARTLSTTFAAGLPLVDALEAVAGGTGNYIYANATRKIRDDISTGQTLQQAMKQTDLFPSIVVQMIAIGEESGTLESMLSKIATIYEEEVDNLVDSLSSLIEPLIMVILGVLVGGLVIAMYMPIFKLGSVV